MSQCLLLFQPLFANHAEMKQEIKAIHNLIQGEIPALICLNNEVLGGLCNHIGADVDQEECKRFLSTPTRLCFPLMRFESQVTT